MSSYARIKPVPVLPNAVRDWYYTAETTGTATTIVDIPLQHRAVGLDWHVWNTGAASVTVTLDGTYTVTIPAGSDRGFDNVKYAVIRVAATDAVTIALTGVML